VGWQASKTCCWSWGWHLRRSLYNLECIETRKEKVSFHFQASASGHDNRHTGMDCVLCFFGQDVHWSDCKSVMVSLWDFEGPFIGSLFKLSFPASWGMQDLCFLEFTVLALS
jgi:hypothetical protein